MGAVERPVTERAIYAARPLVRFGGAEIEAASMGLTSLALTESVDGLASLELKLANWLSLEDGSAGLAFDADSAIALGAAVELLLGGGTPSPVFAGRISGIEIDAGLGAPPGITVRAEDALVRARLARRTQVYEALSLSDLARRIGSDLGLTVEVDDLPSITALWAQFNESDLAFLRRVLARHDCTLSMRGTELRVGRRIAGGETIDLQLLSQLRRVQVSADLAHQCTRVTAAGFDPAQGAAFNVEASGVSLGSGQGRRGDELLAQHFGQRSEHLAELSSLNEREAQALADSAFDRRAREFVTARGSVEGNPRLRAGSRVALAGLGRRFDNTYEVARCTHRFDLVDGYQTDFVAHCAFLAEA
jgi:phage protein D